MTKKETEMNHRAGFGRALMRLAVIGASLCAAFSASAQTIELKATHFLPPNHTFHKELQRWADELAQKSGGRLKISIFPSAQMGPPPRQFDLVRTGVADIGVALTGLTPGRFPMTEISNLPFACPTSSFCSKRMSELAPKYLAGEYAGVKLLHVVITSPLVLHLSKTKINTISDFKGLRIRYAGELFAQSVKAFGGTPVAVPPGDVVDAMGKGTIDGALFPFEAAQSFQLGSVTK
jgi:TRAP-type transport system periplasmic protein